MQIFVVCWHMQTGKYKYSLRPKIFFYTNLAFKNFGEDIAVFIGVLGEVVENLRTLDELWGVPYSNFAFRSGWSRLNFKKVYHRGSRRDRGHPLYPPLSNLLRKTVIPCLKFNPWLLNKMVSHIGMRTD